MDYNEYYEACWLLTLISILKYGPVWKACSHGHVDLTGISTFVYPNLEFTRIVKGKDRGYLFVPLDIWRLFLIKTYNLFKVLRRQVIQLLRSLSWKFTQIYKWQNPILSQHSKPFREHSFYCIKYSFTA